MANLLLLLRDIIQLRRGPQDMPHSPQLLVGVCAAILILQLVISYILDLPGESLPVGVIDLAINLGILYCAFTLRNLGNRFVQTATTLLSCAILFSLVLLPMDVVFIKHPPIADQVSPLHVLLVLIALPIFAWKLIVDAHIFRHSFNLPFFGGVCAAILWITVAYGISAALNPHAPAN